MADDRVSLLKSLTSLPQRLGAIGAWGIFVLLVLAYFQAAPTFLAGVGVVWLLLMALSRPQPQLHTPPTKIAAPKPVPPVASEPGLFPIKAADLMSALPGPVMIIGATEREEKASRRILTCNPEAVRVFQAPKDGGLLVSCMRQPQVLEGVEAALFEDQTSTVVFEVTGSQFQVWRAFIIPLPAEIVRSESGIVRLQKNALLVLRDETDIRRLERMRADFLANASHELRSPLASLSGFIETLRTHARDDSQARDRFLNIMATQADRMGRLISDLMSLSRIEMNEHVPPSGTADLALGMREVVEGLSLMASKRGVEFDLKGPPSGIYPIHADRNQVLQVIQNLTDNALKYAPDQSRIDIRLTINETIDATTPPSEEGASRMMLLKPDRSRDTLYMRLSIRDHGAGIKREFLPRLAERFYRVEGQKSGDRLGTGLGLAIVKHIVNRHRGGLVVESRAISDSDVSGRGPVARLSRQKANGFTEFSVYFPQSHPFAELEATPFATKKALNLKPGQSRRAAVLR